MGHVPQGETQLVLVATAHGLLQDDPPLPEDDENKEKRTDDISSWDAISSRSVFQKSPVASYPFFPRWTPGPLFELILAANYLNIQSLLDVTCKAVAKMIKGKKPANKLTNRQPNLNHLDPALFLYSMLPTGKTPRGDPKDVQHQE